MENYTFTENGNYQINKKHKDARSAVYTTGVLGSATATVTYRNLAGTYIPFTDGLLVINDQIPVEHGAGVDLYVTVAGATATTAIEIMCAGVD